MLTAHRLVVRGHRGYVNQVIERALEFHRRALVADIHIHPMLGGFPRPDRMRHAEGGTSPWWPLGHCTLPAMRDGGVNLAVCALYALSRGVPELRRRALRRQITTLREWHDDGAIKIVRSPHDVRSDSARPQFVLAIESGAHLMPDLSDLEELHQLGVRSLIPVHFRPNAFGSTCHVEDFYDPGLSARGAELIDRLVDLGWVIDLSHCSRKTFDQILERTEAPVIASHVGLKVENDISRNLSHAQITEIARRRGVIGIVFHKNYLRPIGDREIGVPEIADTVERLADMAGYDSLAIGSDMDAPIELPEGLSSPRHLPNLTAELLERGWPETALQGLWGGNFLRVWKAVDRGGAASI